MAFLRALIALVKHKFQGVFFIAEEVSGFPRLGRPISEFGIGFDFNLAMNTPNICQRAIEEFLEGRLDYTKLAEDLKNRKLDEQYIVYTESHDQCIHGGSTLISRLLGDKRILS